MTNFQHQLDLLPGYLGSHLKITVIALAVGIAVSLPLAIAAVKWRPARWPVLSIASIIQTIPSLALLALMVPLLGLFGFWPAVIALILYSILPILRNTVTGILGVDPAMTEAARGLGMTPTQVLLRVELPLAAPVILAGVRTATVWVVGIATLSTPVGQESLGNYIFSGLHLRNWTAVLFGCVAAAVLAIVLDMLIALLESAASRRSAVRAGVALVGLAVVIGGGLGAPAMAQWASDFNSNTPVLSAAKGPVDNAPHTRPFASLRDGVGQQPHPTIRIGAKNFAEQYILADLIANRLQAQGFRTDKTTGLGSTVAFDALKQNQIDLYVDYTGTIWANVMKRDKTPAAWKVLDIMTGYLADHAGIRCLGSLGFENAYALAMRSDQADKLGIDTIADLARYAPRLTFGSDQEFLQRPEWASVRDAYRLRFADTHNYDPTFMYEAIRQGQVDVIPAFSTDGRIAAYHLKVLADPKDAFPPYDAVLLLSPKASHDKALVKALKPLIGAISEERMRHANEMVDVEHKTALAAAAWLSEAIR